MRLSRRLPQAFVGTVLVLTFFVGRPVATTDERAALARLHIDNFGQINEHYYRGEQPDSGDFAHLAALGVRTVIDLTKDGQPDEQRLVEQAGMNFFRIPMTTTDRPSDAAVTQFLELVNNPSNLPVYVHCQGGRHRTGVMTAVYRMTKDGWTARQAYEEMKKYRFKMQFNFLFGHPELKAFVYDYYDQLHLAQSASGPRIGIEPEPSALDR